MANKQGQTIQWSTHKDRQYNGQQTRTDNTMVNKKGQTIQWRLSLCVDHCIVCPCLLAIVLSVLVCWPLYCLSLFVDNTMANKQGQTIQWSTKKDSQYNGQ
jgi:hypothetical protein